MLHRSLSLIALSAFLLLGACTAAGSDPTISPCAGAEIDGLVVTVLGSGKSQGTFTSASAASDTTYELVWPAGYSVSDTAVSDSTGEIVATTGTILNRWGVCNKVGSVLYLSGPIPSPPDGYRFSSQGSLQGSTRA